MSERAMAPKKRVVKPDHVFKFRVPCPYCGGQLRGVAESWEKQDDGTWAASGLAVECDNFDENDHFDMPYVHWHPVIERLIANMKQFVRFDLGETA